MDKLSRLQDKYFDLIVVGGGIVGSGIARDAALRGLSVALFEKGDYCCGTTARSTRLIHGGLRYLETLNFGLVRLDLKEREILLRIAKHLVRPLPFLVPFYRTSPAYRCKVRLGMMLYDLLSFDKSLPFHRRLTRSEIMISEPRLEPQGLQGGFLYYDAQVPSPERLVIENLIDAQEHGAAAYNYSEVIGALHDGNSILGVRVRDLTAMTETEVRSRVVVNAGGPWFDQLSGRLLRNRKARVRMTKGIHLICPSLSRQALVFLSNLDKRLFFIVPWMGQSLVGTTDTDFAGDPGSVQAEEDEVRYLLDSLRPFIPSIWQRQLFYCYAGVRALVPDRGTPSSISRMHRIVDEAENGVSGLISVIGGKITGYRAIAKEAVDIICAKLGVRHECRTAAILLPGSRGHEISNPLSIKFLDEKTVRHLYSIYGSRASEIVDLAQSESRLRVPLAPGYHLDIAAQVVYGIRKEQCFRAGDFLLRRTLLGFSPDQGRRALPGVIACMGDELNWSATKRAEELDAYMQWIHRTNQDSSTAPGGP